MKWAAISIIGVGIIVLYFGIHFFLQGNSIVGPKTSFMYSNPKWIVNGELIAIAGAIIIAIGIWLTLRRSRSISHKS